MDVQVVCGIEHSFVEVEPCCSLACDTRIQTPQIKLPLDMFVVNWWSQSLIDEMLPLALIMI